MDDLLLRNLLRKVDDDEAELRQKMRERFEKPGELLMLDNQEVLLRLIAVYLKRLLGRDG